MQDEKILIELARLILPSGFVENFKITSIVSNESISRFHSMNSIQSLKSARGIK